MSYSRYGIILIFFFGWVCIYGQADGKERLLKDYDRQFRFLDSLMRVPFDNDRWESLFFTESSSFEQPIVTLSFSEQVGQDGVSCRYEVWEEAINQRAEAAEVAARSETGLQFTGNYAYRKSAGGISYWDDEGDLSRLNHRFQSEISWNILQSGLVQSSNKVAACRIGSELERIGYKENLLSISVNQLIDRNEQIYRQAVERIYALRLEHLHLLEQTEQALLEHHPSGSDKLLEIMNDIFLVGTETVIRCIGCCFCRRIGIQPDRYSPHSAGEVVGNGSFR